MQTENQRRSVVDQHLQLAQDKLERLRSLKPILLDVSLREPCFAAPIGHTLQDKLNLLHLSEQFGVRDKIIATLDYQFPQHPQVEDDFCRHLQHHGYDLGGCFALTAIGEHENGAFAPHLSMKKLVDYGLPNTMLEMQLTLGADPQALLADLAASIVWLRQQLARVHGKPGRIYVNLVNLIDIFMRDRASACAALARLATLEADGVSFEDGRGTYFPFQVGAVSAACKAMLRDDQHVLCHIHTGNGMENASAIDALLQGADGYWGGLERTSATIGHASLGELIANLMRAGNQHVRQTYHVGRLSPICEQMHAINTGQAMPATWPVFGADAYRSVLSDFDQCGERPMDLDPAEIGGRYRHRIAPVGSDIPVIRARVRELLEIRIDAEMAQKMILLMREDLRQHQRIDYDHPDTLAQLLGRAQQQT